MGKKLCELCGNYMHKNGTRNGVIRYRCPKCGHCKNGRTDQTLRDFKEFLQYLQGKTTQNEMPGQGRTFRRRTAKFWNIWPLSPIVDEVFDFIFIDAIFLGHRTHRGRTAKSLALLIASTSIEGKTVVLAWHLARGESRAAYSDLLSRIAPPKMVITDGGQGFASAKKQHWTQTRHQRCLFHVYKNITTRTTQHPKLPAGMDLLVLANRLLKIKTLDQAGAWLKDYVAYKHHYKQFLAEKTKTPQGRYIYTHERLVTARNNLDRLIRTNVLFTFLNLQDTGQRSLPSTNNTAESINAKLRNTLHHHRGQSLLRQAKACMFVLSRMVETPLTEAQMLQTWPRDNEIEDHYRQAHNHQTQNQHPAGIGTGIEWSDLHTTNPENAPWNQY